MKVCLTLPKTIKSLNRTQGGKTWQARHHRNKTDRLEWEILLRSELIRNKVSQVLARMMANPLLGGVRHVHITRVWDKGERAFDKDNLIGGCKALVDAMKGVLIVDDSPAKCSISYGQVRGPIHDGKVGGGNTVVIVDY